MNNEHLMQCNACGEFFDMRDLDQVFYHEEPYHLPIPHDSLTWYSRDKIVGVEVKDE